MKTINFFGYPIYTEERLPESLTNKKMIVNTINPHSYCEAKKDDFYQQALLNSDILLPDGIGVILAIWILKGRRIKLFTGSDLHNRLLKKLNKNEGTVFYLGSSALTLKKIQKRVMREYPNIVVGTYAPPYKPVFTDEDNARMLVAINEFRPDVLFVGMTAPKQEKWVNKQKNKINAHLIASVGAVFDFYSGTIHRPGKFWRMLKLEWFVRLIREPKRLWRRTFISTPLFLKDIMLTKIGYSKEHRVNTYLFFLHLCKINKGHENKNI